MSIYVFLGPTLDPAEAQEILRATYLPPVAMGDVYQVMRYRPTAIGIIDGYFEQVPAVWHKEILFALSRGVHVYGAASMGALRAAELCQFGMEGVGQIFEAYRSGEYEDDDEVAVMHGPATAGYRALSEAMVNIREGLSRAEARGLISARTREILVGAAKAQFYPDRSWQSLGTLGQGLAVPTAELEALMECVRRERPNPKREDAIALLRRLRSSGLRPRTPSFVFEQTPFWDRLVQTTKRSDSPNGDEGVGVSDDAIIDHLNLTASDQREALRSALLLFLAVSEAHRVGISTAEGKLASWAERFWRERGLRAVHDTEDWLRSNRMSPEQFTELIELEGFVGELLSYYATQIRDYLPFELRRRSLFGGIAAEAERKWQYLRSQGLTSPGLADAGLDAVSLMEWYRERFDAPVSTAEELAKELGFLSVQEFLSEVVAQYIFEWGNAAGREPGPHRARPAN